MTSSNLMGLGPLGEHRQKFFAAKVMPYSIQEENKMLLKRLAIYKRMHEGIKVGAQPQDQDGDLSMAGADWK